MCGIFAFLQKESDNHDSKLHKTSAGLIQHRGPDSSEYKSIKCFNTKRILDIGFHRLSINGLENGMQPFEKDGVLLVCNGEIYNFKQLIKDYELLPETKSDCEVILLLYLKYGMEATIQLLHGVFAFVLVDTTKNLLFAARDPIGVRPLFVTKSSNHLGFASEAKSLVGIQAKTVEWFSKEKHDFNVKNIKPFLPNQCISYDLQTLTSVKMYPVSVLTLPFEIDYDPSLFVQILKKSIETRLDNSDRPVGLFLSGGLDSSVVSALAQQIQKEKGLPPLHSFSIAIVPDGETVTEKLAPDVFYARKVAKHIGTKHHEVTVPFSKAFDALEKVVYFTETYDTTTVRASTPMYLLSKFIEKNTDIKVLLSGEGADELLGGYLYFHSAPSVSAFQNESLRLVDELYRYDVLRADRTTSACGLELRVPFLDIHFVKHALNLKTKEKMHRFSDTSKPRIEKWCMRNAVEKCYPDLLPKEILWRQKDAFSDAVGYNWVSGIKEKTKGIVQKGKGIQSDKLTKEQIYYKTLYEKYYQMDLIGGYWMPMWQTGVTDPSATVLQIHQIQN